MSRLESVANTAIFERQLPFDRAVRFVTREANVARETAEQALRQVVVWYKKPR
jgi:hypothetical protein